jgi:hypothetical protein
MPSNPDGQGISYMGTHSVQAPQTLVNSHWIRRIRFLRNGNGQDQLLIFVASAFRRKAERTM